MGYETTSFSGKFLFHRWALHPLVCPIFSEITPVEMRPEDRLADVAARQFQIWKEADFRTFKPQPKSFASIFYLTPLLARTFCGIFAGLFVAPLGIVYHGSMIGKEFFGTPGPGSAEKIQKHKEALVIDGAAFVATLGFVCLFLPIPAQNLKDLNPSRLFSLWRSRRPLDNLSILAIFVCFAVHGTYFAVFERGQAFWKRDEACLLSQKLHKYFGLIGLDGNRLPSSPRDYFFTRDPTTGKVDTNRHTWTWYQLVSMRAFMDTECLLAAIEAKAHIDPFPYEYPINGDKIADLLPKGQEELASRLRKLQYAASSMKDMLGSLVYLHNKKIGYKPDIPEDLYRAIFFANSDVAQLRAMGVGSRDWLDLMLDLRRFLGSQDSEAWSQLGAFHEKWKELAKKNGKYSGSYPFANFEDALEYKVLSIFALSRLERPEVLIYTLTHSDQSKNLEPLGKELVYVLQKLKKGEITFELRKAFLKLDPEELNTIFNQLDQRHRDSQDDGEKDQLAFQMNFIKNCQNVSMQELKTFVDLLPAFEDRRISDGLYIERLIDLFDKDQENRVPDLLTLLKLCQKEYLASKEERDQAYVENFFMHPRKRTLEKSRRIFERSKNPYVSRFGKGLGNTIDERNRNASKSGDEGRISYAHLFTGTPRGEPVSFETLTTHLDNLRESLLAQELSSTIYKPILEENDEKFIFAFFTFVQQKVREQLIEMHKGEEQKQEDLGAPEASSSSSSVHELD